MGNAAECTDPVFTGWRIVINPDNCRLIAVHVFNIAQVQVMWNGPNILAPQEQLVGTTDHRYQRTKVPGG
ncbi:hypothetical protein F3K52_08470 [Pseudomonas lactis]|nr:hypothetical protein F3K52_08470 [Pseudomonas lactis]